MRSPDTLHRAKAHAGSFGHHSPRPMRGLAGRLGQGQVEHAPDRLVGQSGLSGRTGHVALLPAPHAGLGQTRAARDLHGPTPLGVARMTLARAKYFWAALRSRAIA